ncbi:AP-5 complex subunit mu, partial [Cucurbita argyrosperma subsp. argyrosperma]
EADSDIETESASDVVSIEEFLMEKMSKDHLPPVELEEPFCWQAYNYAKVSFKILGASLSGISVHPKSQCAPACSVLITVHAEKLFGTL